MQAQQRFFICFIFFTVYFGCHKEGIRDTESSNCGCYLRIVVASLETCYQMLLQGIRKECTTIRFPRCQNFQPSSLMIETPSVESQFRHSTPGLVDGQWPCLVAELGTPPASSNVSGSDGKAESKHSFYAVFAQFDARVTSKSEIREAELRTEPALGVRV